MSKKPIYWNKAKRILSKKDTVMKKLINNYKDGSLTTRNDVFFSLCKSIIGLSFRKRPNTYCNTSKKNTKNYWRYIIIIQIYKCWLNN